MWLGRGEGPQQGTEVTSWQEVPERTGGECFVREAKEKHEMVPKGSVLGEQRL